MVSLPFDFKHRKTYQKVTYGVGNPMGAYSSWNSFALAHHYILYWCCKELGMEWKTSEYLLLGDDILIGNDALAAKYRETILALGVPISELKTHSSDKLFEFAKRLVLSGTEITPFPISALSETSRRFYLLLETLKAEEGRGWSWVHGIPATVDKFYTDVLGFNGRKASEFKERTLRSDVITNVIKGVVPPGDGLNSIIGRYNLPLPEFTDEMAISVISKVAQEVFEHSNPLDYTKGKPLGLIAESLVIDLTSVVDLSIEAAASLPSSIPLLNVFGQVSEKYMELREQVLSLKPGEWSVAVRSSINGPAYFRPGFLRESLPHHHACGRDL